MDIPIGQHGQLRLSEALTRVGAGVFAEELPSEWQSLLVEDVTVEQWSTVWWLLPEQRPALEAFLDQYQAGLGQQAAIASVPLTADTSALPPEVRANILSNLTPGEIRRVQHLPGFALGKVGDAMAQHEWSTTHFDAEGVWHVYGHADLNQAVEQKLAGTSEFHKLAVHFVLGSEDQDLLRQILHRLSVHLYDGAVLTDLKEGSHVIVHSGGTVTKVNGGDITVHSGGKVTGVEFGNITVHSEGAVTGVKGGLITVHSGGTVTGVINGNVRVESEGTVTGVKGGDISTEGSATIYLDDPAEVNAEGVVETDEVNVTGKSWSPIPSEAKVFAAGKQIHGPGATSAY